jgi:hypothetical protein
VSLPVAPRSGSAACRLAPCTPTGSAGWPGTTRASAWRSPGRPPAPAPTCGSMTVPARKTRRRLLSAHRHSRRRLRKARQGRRRLPRARQGRRRLPRAREDPLGLRRARQGRRLLRARQGTGWSLVLSRDRERAFARPGCRTWRRLRLGHTLRGRESRWPMLLSGRRVLGQGRAWGRLGLDCGRSTRRGGRRRPRRRVGQHASGR